MYTLPIDSYQSKFNELLQKHHLVVEAETGSGKSTRLPIWASKQGRVLVVEPRRIACTSLASFLAEQTGEQLGQSVGYSIKLDAHFSEDTQVVFVTPGVALRWLAEDALASFDIVIIDEFHERRWDIDLLVALLRQRQSHRLVVTSATIEGEKLARYLEAERIVCEGRVYPVAITNRATESRKLPDSRNLESRIFEEVLNSMSSSGDILVFLPGRKEITQCEQALRRIDDIEVCCLHASVTDQARDKALTPSSVKKVILATNVAETSLTIPNVGVVIDSGLERRNVQRNGRTALTLMAISKASANQRKGRAGRVMAGQCVRLYGEHAALELVTPPELQREDLTEPMLASACCGSRLASLAFLETLPNKSLAKAEQALQMMGAIDCNQKLTEHGKRLYPLPIDTLYADLVTRIESKPLKEAMIDLTAALSVPARLYQLPSDPEKLDDLAKTEKYGCDLSLLIQLVRGKSLSSINIDQQALAEAQGLARQMRGVFELPQLEVASRYDRDLLLQAILSFHPELAFVRRVKRREAFANGDLEVLLGRNSRVAEKVEAMLVLDTHSLPGRGVKQTLTLATVTAPVSLALLVDIQLGEWQQGRTILDDGAVRTEMSLMYAGREIATKLMDAEGSLSLKPIIDLVMSGVELQGLAEQRRVEIKHWQLYVALGLSDSTPMSPKLAELNVESWLNEQLTSLGVSDVDELELFSHQDLPFDGIPEWEYENFAVQYPFRLSLASLQLEVEYIPQRKLIYVVYQGGLRKTVPKRWELPTWSGWRVQYKKASRIVDIK